MAFKILSATFLQDGNHSFTLDFTQPEVNYKIVNTRY